jgi:hypothetical protein
VVIARRLSRWVWRYRSALVPFGIALAEFSIAAIAHPRHARYWVLAAALTAVAVFVLGFPLPVLRRQRTLDNALADNLTLTAEVARLTAELSATRLDTANLLAAARATLVAHTDGEADPCTTSVTSWTPARRSLSATGGHHDQLPPDAPARPPSTGRSARSDKWEKIIRKWSDHAIPADGLPCRPDVPMRCAGQGRGRYLREMRVAFPVVTPESARWSRRKAWRAFEDG